MSEQPKQAPDALAKAEKLAVLKEEYEKNRAEVLKKTSNDLHDLSDMDLV